MKNVCFWKGHNPTKDYHIDPRLDSGYYCSVCKTTDFSKGEFGKKLLEFLDQAKRIILAILLIIGVIALFLGVIWAIDYPIDLASCKTFASQNSLPYIYKFWYGCMIHYNGHWVSPEGLVQLFK
jgi:hypothetical protein